MPNFALKIFWGSICSLGGMVIHSVRHQIHDLKVTGSSPSRVVLCSNLGQAIYTYVPLSPRSIIWYWPNGWGVNRHTSDALAPYPWSRSVNWCLAEGYRNGDQCCTMGDVARARLLFYPHIYRPLPPNSMHINHYHSPALPASKFQILCYGGPREITTERNQ